MLWESVEEVTGEMTMDFSSRPLARNLDAADHSPLNLDVSMHDMVIDDMSFYADEETRHQEVVIDSQQSSSIGLSSTRNHQLNFADIPQPMSLLSPECSPQRFLIVEKPVTNKFRDSLNSISAMPQQEQQESNNGNSCANSSDASRTLRVYNSLSSSSSTQSSIEDDYMELFEMESLAQSLGSHSLLNFPSDLNSLISGQIKSSSSPANRVANVVQQQWKTPEMRRPSVRRCLSMTENSHHQQKTPETLLKQIQEAANVGISTTPCSSKLSSSATITSSDGSFSCSFKRPDPPSNSTSPSQNKRYREEEKENLDDSLKAMLTLTPTRGDHKVHHHLPLRKSMSMNDAEIMSAIARSENQDGPDLIGDFSRPFALPLLEGRHRDLKSISCDTMARLLHGDFDDEVATYKIIDCRYPYEYEGGHIRGAKNLYTHEQIIEEFLTPQKTEQQELNIAEKAKGKRNIIIFHCEFSSERGPKLSRFLRNNDRARNTNLYPTLDYPEIYLLHNGYKEFYERHGDLCDPHAYRPMLEPAYNSAYRHFRAKSKSWNGDGIATTSSRLKKSRSRLML